MQTSPFYALGCGLQHPAPCLPTVLPDTTAAGFAWSSLMIALLSLAGLVLWDCTIGVHTLEKDNCSICAKAAWGPLSTAGAIWCTSEPSAFLTLFDYVQFLVIVFNMGIFSEEQKVIFVTFFPLTTLPKDVR